MHSMHAFKTVAAWVVLFSLAPAHNRPPLPPPPLLPPRARRRQVLRQPDDAMLAFLLGTAIGVMFLLSFAEMWVRNAMEHGWPEVTASALLGALLYQLIQPFLPDLGGADEGPAAAAAVSAGPGRGPTRRGEAGLLLARPAFLHPCPLRDTPDSGAPARAAWRRRQRQGAFGG